MPNDLLVHESKLLRAGHRSIAGVDEAGRGPLAGPVVAAAVVLSLTDVHPDIDDSKKLSPQAREELFFWLRERAVGIGVGIIEADEIDRVNILQATFQAMRQALLFLPESPDAILVDGNRTIPGIEIPQTALVGGDAVSASIASASIIAKVTRDRLMRAHAGRWPAYGFERHKGYGTVEHLRAIAEHGPCPIHRTTFAGVGKQQLKMEIKEVIPPRQGRP